MLVAPKFATKINPRVIRELSESPPPWGPAGFVTYARTYSRTMPGLGRNEHWHDTVERCLNGLLDIGGVFDNEQIEELAYYWYNLKGMPAGRPLWQLGTETVRRLGGDSLQNCWHVACDEPIEPFCFAFNELMLGGGVGFNILPENVFAIPAVKFTPHIERVESFDCDFIVTDNREGWVELLRRVLHAYFYTGKMLRYCTRGIRGKDSPINGFGGTASGPEELVRGIKLICKILDNACGRKLRPVECMDIMNIIAMIVVAGNVRRSAEISIGEFMDDEYLLAKDWSRMIIPEWRQQSNNTVRCHDTMQLPEHFWNGYRGQGEPYGLYNEDLCKHYGRLTDPRDYRPDLRIKGPNPCAEILLENYEACNLADIFLPNIASPAEFARVASLLFRAAKAIGSLPYINDRTTEVVRRNNRIGIGVTGYLGSEFVGESDVFDAVYAHLEETDEIVSRQMNLGKSIKMTCVKPSGTLSLLAGCCPGVHPAFAPYYIRRITFAASNPLVKQLQLNGHNMAPKINIDGSFNYESLIVDFPYAMPEGTICARDLTAIDQLENQSFLQHHWADNAVSMTCYYKQEELSGIRGWLRENYPTDVKTASFLLHKGHGFVQAPYEEITREQYLELSSKVTPLLDAHIEGEILDLPTEGCENGACPVR